MSMSVGIFEIGFLYVHVSLQQRWWIDSGGDRT